MARILHSDIGNSISIIMPCSNLTHCCSCHGPTVLKYLRPSSIKTGSCCGDAAQCLTDCVELLEQLGDDHAEARRNSPFTLQLNESRFIAYRTIWNYLKLSDPDKYSGGNKGNRKQLPTCIEALVKEAFDPGCGAGGFTGFVKSMQQRGNGE